MALSKVDLANMVENVAPESSIPDVSFRNIIINGDMSIAQRSTSVTSISSGNTIHTCDRWKTYASSAGTWTQTQEALTSGDPYTNGFATSLKLDCTTANSSLSSGSYLQIAQSIEAQNLQYIKKGTSNAEQLTASFWVKSTKTGTNILQFVSLDNTVRICAKSYTINSSDTWEKKTITIPADTSSTGKIDNNNGEGMRMIFWIAAGTDYTSGTLATTWADTANANRAVGQINNADSTSNNFEITGVQLEVGTAASDFEFLPYDVNKNRCYRYYYKIAPSGLKFVGYAQVDNDNLNCVAIIDFKVDMRTAPTAVEAPSSASAYKLREALTYNCTAVPSFNTGTIYNSSLSFKRQDITSSDGFAQGELLKAGLSGATLAWSAEL